MPSLWPHFDRADAEIMGDDLPDVISFSDSLVEAILLEAGHKRVTDMVGYTEEEWGYLNEATPPEFQETWTPDHNPWFPIEEGLAMCATLRKAIVDPQNVLNQYPSMRDLLLEDIADFEKVLQRAVPHGAQFQLTLDT